MPLSKNEGEKIPQEEMSEEARQIIGKARRSFGFSLAILLLGFIAITMALVYRSVREPDLEALRYPISQIDMPAGAELLFVAPGADRLALTYRLEGRTMVRFIDVRTGDLIQDLPVIGVTE